MAFRLGQLGFVCQNAPDIRTHITGTVIDLIWTDGVPFAAPLQVSDPGSVAASDHALVWGQMFFQMTSCFRECFGRVWWLSSSEWDAALLAVDVELAHFAELIKDLSLHPEILGLAEQSTSTRRRRALLDGVMWLRDAWYTLAGHLVGLVAGHQPTEAKPPRSLPAALASTWHDAGGSSEGFRRTVNELEWRRKRETICRFANLKCSDPSHADRFLSNVLKPRMSLQLDLRDESGNSLNTHDSLDALKTDLLSRSTHALSRSSAQTMHASSLVSRIRLSRGVRHPCSGCLVPCQDHEFSTTEAAAALDQLHRGSRAIRGCYAAMKCSSFGGRYLSLQIANFCLRMGLFPSSCTLREFNHIRKSGQTVVRSVSCLRAVSFSSEMAAFLDALILSRCKPILEEFWGTDQAGGIYDALSSVLCVVLVAQMRVAFGLPLILIFLDLIAAFDVADRDDMRLAAFEAGVGGRLWMLIDDLLASDHSRIHLANLKSDDFALSLGTAQGRRLSVHLFNGLMRYLRDCISRRSRGVGVWNSNIAVERIRNGYQMYPSILGPYCSSAVQRGSSIKSILDDSTASSAFLSSWESAAIRLGIIDEAAPFSIITSQYVDDAVAFASSSEQACSICRGAEDFTATHGGSFNVGPSKSAALPIGRTFLDHDVGGLSLDSCPLPKIESYRYLGVLIDRHLSFNGQLLAILGKGRRAFEDFFGCASSIDLPFPILSAAVPQRVVANVRYGLEFVVAVEGAESALNRMQVVWARTLLGLRGHRVGLWPFLVAECGWSMRLGTIMLEQALMLKARTQLLPEAHPAKRVLSLTALSSVAIPWPDAVSEIQRRLGLTAPLPDITATVSDTDLEEAGRDKGARLKILHHYKSSVVRPACIRYDQAAFDAAGTRDWWFYAEHQSSLRQLPFVLLTVDWDVSNWLHYKLWAVVRVTGRFPLQFFGFDSMPKILPFCPLCRSPDATMEHVLSACGSTLDLYTAASHHLGLFCPSTRPSWLQLRLCLFAWSSQLSDNLARISYVGRCCERVAEVYCDTS